MQKSEGSKSQNKGPKAAPGVFEKAFFYQHMTTVANYYV